MTPTRRATTLSGAKAVGSTMKDVPMREKPVSHARSTASASTMSRSQSATRRTSDESQRLRQEEADEIQRYEQRRKEYKNRYSRAGSLGRMGLGRRQSKGAVGERQAREVNEPADQETT